MFQVEFSKVCQHVHFLIRSNENRTSNFFYEETVNSELNYQYASMPIRASKIVIDTFHKRELKTWDKIFFYSFFCLSIYFIYGFPFIIGKACDA